MAQIINLIAFELVLAEPLGVGHPMAVSLFAP
jgi:hypothetical protein